jgi:oligoendopeptidase F
MQGFTKKKNLFKYILNKPVVRKKFKASLINYENTIIANLVNHNYML